MKSLKVRCNVINLRFDYILWKKIQDIESDKDRRKFVENLTKEMRDSLEKYTYGMLGWSSKYAEVKGIGYMEDMLERRKLISHNSLEFTPYLSRLGIPKTLDSFNMFTGFPLEDVTPIKIHDFEQSGIYKHIKEEMMSNDPGEMCHFMDHIADMIQDPAVIKANDHMFISKQGCGKGLFYKFVSKLLGSDHCTLIDNMDAYFGKFNSDQSNKILKTFEEVKEKGSAFNNADRLKADIAKTTIRIEPKGCDPYSQAHCSRFWGFSQNAQSFYIEGDDRRYTCHYISSKYADNEDYFKPLWDEVDDNDFCKSAFEYFATRKYDIRNAFRCFDNKFKAQQKQGSLSNGLKYICETVESNFEGLRMDSDKVPCKELSRHYNEWCSDNGVKFSLNTLKTQLLKINIEARTLKVCGKSTKCYVFEVENLRKEFGELLKDPGFQFDILEIDE